MHITSLAFPLHNPTSFIAVTGEPVVLARTGGATFDFEGAYFAAWADNPSASVTVTGWRGSTLVGVEVFSSLNPNGFEFRESGLKGLDALVFENDGTVGHLWLMDGFSDAISVPVPEPATLVAGALLLLPFGASTFRFMRKNRAA